MSYILELKVYSRTTHLPVCSGHLSQILLRDVHRSIACTVNPAEDNRPKVLKNNHRTLSRDFLRTAVLVKSLHEVSNYLRLCITKKIFKVRYTSFLKHIRTLSSIELRGVCLQVQWCLEFHQRETLVSFSFFLFFFCMLGQKSASIYSYTVVRKYKLHTHTHTHTHVYVGDFLRGSIKTRRFRMSTYQVQVLGLVSIDKMCNFGEGTRYIMQRTGIIITPTAKTTFNLSSPVAVTFFPVIS